MEKRIPLKRIWPIMEQKNRTGKPVPFSFQYAKKDGTLKNYANATLSSIHSKGATVNIIPEGESKPHTFRKICITRFNGDRVYI